MNKSLDTKLIQDNIRKAIEAGSVKMRPKWHFIARTALLTVGLALVFFTGVYLASFIIFILHQTGVWFLPVFGLSNIHILLFSLPWLLIVIAGIFIILVEILLRQYPFAYRRPLMYSACGVIAFVILGGIVVAATPLHDRFYTNAKLNKLPFAGTFYRQFGMEDHHSIHPGMIVEIGEDRFLIESPRNESFVVLITPQTTFPCGTDFVVQDKIIVLGERASSTIIAQGICHINDAQIPRRTLGEHHVILKMK
jgi:hypothetical protein